MAAIASIHNRFHLEANNSTFQSTDSAKQNQKSYISFLLGVRINVLLVAIDSLNSDVEKIGSDSSFFCYEFSQTWFQYIIHKSMSSKTNTN